MRILHVVASDIRRGGEVFATDLMRGLSASSDVRQRVAVLHGSDIAQLTFPVPSTVMKGAKSRHHRLDLGIVLRLRENVRHWKPNTIQAHGGEALKYCVLAGIPHGARLVYRRIGLSGPWVNTELKTALHSGLIRRSSAVVAVSDAVASDLADIFHIGTTPIYIIPNAVDPQRVLRRSRSDRELRRLLDIAPGARVLLSIGALSWEKDPVRHLQIAICAMRESPNSVFVMVGDGLLRPEIERQIRVAGVSSRVRLLGQREDIGDLLGISDVLLLASRTEGMPACVIEAGMAGIPCVAPRLGGIPEVVSDHETGLLACPDDDQGFAGAVEMLLRDPELAARYGAAARVRCQERFSIVSNARAYLSLYQELLAA